MAEPRRAGAPSRLATRGYAPQPVRPVAVQAATRAAVCAVCLTLGAAAATWHAQHPAPPTSPCPMPPAEDLVQVELARTRLALAQEGATRAALQKTTDETSAELVRLSTELRFLRGQGAKRP